ncbi:hypothetical protein [Streptomyces sp. 891-h]|uniref:hypothetical protein n=1 Tax=unclassified Streptomyces TaxID=2593676 RepID=UPI001FAA2497|nr:hypothetical protein [Streptomyces sp. 891-h]UNZ16159.1 hypothetical protein HC362_02685 [Streptomyces sp. 891-h]
MFRRSAPVLATLVATTALAVAPAAAAEAAESAPGKVTPGEQVALKVAEQVLGKVLGGAVTLGGQ